MTPEPHEIETRVPWDINKLMADARAMRERHPEVRYGQSVYNAAYATNPAVAHLSRTGCDPFYDDNKVGAFLTALVNGRAEEPA